MPALHYFPIASKGTTMTCQYYIVSILHLEEQP